MKITSTVVLVLSLVVLGALSAYGQTKDGDKKVQTVTLTVGEGGYVVTPATVAKGVPVKMDVDLKSVKGCARTVVISAFKVRKTVNQNDATIEFTPDKSGKIDIVCGMNMVKGSFTVAQQ